MESNKRPCRACEGTGYPKTAHVYGAGTRLSSAYTIGRDGKDCPRYCSERTSLGYAAWKAGRDARNHPCSVCLGSGHVSHLVSDSGKAGQSMRDAMADADTLIYFSGYQLGVQHRPTAFGEDLCDAIRFASPVYQELTMVPFAPSGDLAWEYAQRAARAAFRAVPGLRGE